MAHFLYANACAKSKHLITTTWDMYQEKMGFMLTFWNMADVPFSYCHCTLYLANQDPAKYAWNKYALTAFFFLYLFVYWVWDTSNGQKDSFRTMERGTFVKRRTFPQLPWQELYNPKTIMADNGDAILADGWYGLALFFTVMIARRAMRDITKCRQKYGDAWRQYEKQVPYLFIPVNSKLCPLSDGL
ncbi:hypothetical protein BELL_0139g00120 [Botrytis elliptica]|uniref:Delta(24(24(1)))-sterol reductase n=1 Tax=Botrytis elliptica TaxID=278938 RepID=A0A4Z1K5Y0_9HELO|nr:hypothetical protein BELL_0139g00120 [Botrytis elliptica]